MWRRVGVVLVALACHTQYEAHFVKPDEASTLGQLKDQPFLKCHLKNGGVVVLEAWAVDEVNNTVRGYGVEYDMYRDKRSVLESKVVPLADVVLLETNRPYQVQTSTGAIVALAIGAGASLAVTAVCLTNTKACFGSCPTFFADDGRGLALQAEGFSESVARALEATDVDAMWTVAPKGRSLEVVMTNDALETHVVDSVRVLAARRPDGGRVLRAGTSYFAVTHLTPPTTARAESGDVTEALRDSDGNEYKSMASSTDLAERETVDVRFGRRAGKRLGLLVVDRNSLLNTFLFYQALAYAGRKAGDWLAAMERDGKASFAGVGTLLGDIDISVRNSSGAFVPVGAVGEVGPIAREAELVVFPEELTQGDAKDIDVRLTMAKGNWRVDQIALVEVGDAVTPVAIEPRVVQKDGKPDDSARAALLDPTRHLVTYPHDAYTLEFDLPEGDLELFLESRGYYYEWMRDEWLREEDPLAAALMVLNPHAALRKLAPKFKELEPTMDRIFWQSRVPRW
jgi:hypothetical protein